MEGILGAPTVRGRVGQRADRVEQLDHRAGPAVGHDQRQRVLVRRRDVDEVDVHGVDLRDELRQLVQPRLDPPEVVLVQPVAGERLRWRRAARPATGRRPAPCSASVSRRYADADRRSAPPKTRPGTAGSPLRSRQWCSWNDLPVLERPRNLDPTPRLPSWATARPSIVTFLDRDSSDRSRAPSPGQCRYARAAYSLVLAVRPPKSSLTRSGVYGVRLAHSRRSHRPRRRGRPNRVLPWLWAAARGLQDSGSRRPRQAPTPTARLRSCPSHRRSGRPIRAPQQSRR